MYRRINVFYISDLTQVWEVLFRFTMSGFTPKHINENKLKAFSLGAMGHKAASRLILFKTYLKYIELTFVLKSSAPPTTPQQHTKRLMCGGGQFMTIIIY